METSKLWVLEYQQYHQWYRNTSIINEDAENGSFAVKADNTCKASEVLTIIKISFCLYLNRS